MRHCGLIALTAIAVLLASLTTISVASESTATASFADVGVPVVKHADGSISNELPNKTSGPACNRDYYKDSKTTKVADGSFTKDRRPVVYVHGYNSKLGVWSEGNNPADILYRQTDQRIQNFAFDYANQSLIWASDPGISACLGQYISEVGESWKAAGGDGRILVVAHSMGGLAAMYAADEAFAQYPAKGYTGGIVTFDTPYLGSGWGKNNKITGGVEQLSKIFTSSMIPDPETSAGRCLAPHKNGERLPYPCAADLPPELPSSIKLTTIAGNILVKRELLGFHVYDIPLNSDGIVSVESSNGYAKAYSPSPGTSNVTVKDLVNCSITTGDIQSAWKSINGVPQAVGSLGGSLYDLSSDGWTLALHSFDEKGTMGADRSGDLNLYGTMAVANLKASCSHINIIHNQSALNKATEALKTYLNDLDRAEVTSTEVRTATPLDEAGDLRTGMNIDQTVAQLGTDVYPSPNGGTAYFIPSADTTGGGFHNCWVTRTPTMAVCMFHPTDTGVTMVNLNQELSSPPEVANSTVQPWAIVLDDGTSCTYRTQGATSLRYTYFCDGDELKFPVSNVDRSTEPWTIQQVNAKSMEDITDRENPPTRTAQIVTAWFNGSTPVTFSSGRQLGDLGMRQPIANLPCNGGLNHPGMSGDLQV